MGGSAGSLSAAVSKADAQVTVLDDRIDAENDATLLWMRSHRLSRSPHDHVVIGTELLSPEWAEQAKNFRDAASAETYLQHFGNNHAAMNSLGQLARSLTTLTGGPLSKAMIFSTVGAALVSRRAWVIAVPKKPKSRFITKTDPSAFAKLNPRFGTKVDFAYIAKLEGDQWLRGYVPMRKGQVVGKSGMTIASGFDIGQWYLEDLKQLDLPDTIMDKIKPFVAPNNFKGMDKKQVAAKVAKLAPVPELLKAEADQCDGAVFAKKLKEAISAWDRRREKGVPAYTDLPGGWQTVWLSRVYQGKTGLFGTLALAGKWKEALTALRSDKDYPERTNQEADLIGTDLPAQPAPKPKATR